MENQNYEPIPYVDGMPISINQELISVINNGKVQTFIKYVSNIYIEQYDEDRAILVKELHGGGSTIEYIDTNSISRLTELYNIKNIKGAI
jgi:hypothetical protein